MDRIEKLRIDYVTFPAVDSGRKWRQIAGVADKPCAERQTILCSSNQASGTRDDSIRELQGLLVKRLRAIVYKGLWSPALLFEDRNPDQALAGNWSEALIGGLLAMGGRLSSMCATHAVSSSSSTTRRMTAWKIRGSDRLAGVRGVGLMAQEGGMWAKLTSNQHLKKQ
ncbi:hypothetical protein BKA80DRAFT_39638 [Phyllosticta citrichinensis]